MMSQEPTQSIVNMFRDAPWPGSILSNFAQTPFAIDGVRCSCSEAFIQALKFPDTEEQIELCRLPAQEASERGTKVTDRIFSIGSIWWLGATLPLHSAEHFQLVKRALVAKFTQSKEAREALVGSGSAMLTHDFGRPKGCSESLPIDVFCQIVTDIRRDIQVE